MSSQQESWFTKWLRNGRLSALTFLVIFSTWVGFQVAKLPPAPILDQLLLTISGVLVGNLAIKKSSDDKRALEEKADDY